jgi:hypothetical protein
MSVRLWTRRWSPALLLLLPSGRSLLVDRLISPRPTSLAISASFIPTHGSSYNTPAQVTTALTVEAATPSASGPPTPRHRPWRLRSARLAQEAEDAGGSVRRRGVQRSTHKSQSRELTKLHDVRQVSGSTLNVAMIEVPPCHGQGQCKSCPPARTGPLFSNAAAVSWKCNATFMQ